MVTDRKWLNDSLSLTPLILSYPQSRIAIASKNGEVTKLRVLYALFEVLLRLLLYERVNKKNREKKYIYSVEASIKD